MAEERKRQRRGMQRMESLLDAAGVVFAEVGYERATTNQIAAKANVSPGTLYQFFPHKAAMAEALATRYADSFESVHAHVLTPGIEQRPLSEFIDVVVDPFLDFHRQAPAFEALLLAGAFPGELSERVQTLKQTFAKRLAKLFLLRRPHNKPKEMQLAAEVSMSIFSGLLPMLMKGTQASRKRAAQELKRVLEGYLAPLLDNGSRV